MCCVRRSCPETTGVGTVLSPPNISLDTSDPEWPKSNSPRASKNRHKNKLPLNLPEKAGITNRGTTRHQPQKQTLCQKPLCKKCSLAVEWGNVASPRENYYYDIEHPSQHRLRSKGKDPNKVRVRVLLKTHNVPLKYKTKQTCPKSCSKDPTIWSPKRDGFSQDEAKEN